MDKRSINAALDLNFAHLHWQRMRLCYMPPAFVRDIDVSPFFLAQPLRRPSGYYVMSGYLGLVCQPFERAYFAQHGVPRTSGRPWNPIWLASHIANIDSIRECGLIQSENDVQVLCKHVATLLEQLPHSLADLRNSLNEGRLLGQPLSTWNPAQPEKLEALIAYLTV
jgi:hypothetical protein